MARVREGRLGLLLGVTGLLGASVGAGAAVGAPPPVQAPEPPAAGRVPARLVSTTLATDEILLALLRPEQLLAVGPFASDPAVSNVAEQAARVPHHLAGDPELLVALEPGLVLTDPFDRPEVQDLLRRSGVPVLEVPPCQSLADIRRNVRWVGEVIGARPGAGALVAEMDRSLEDTRRRVAGVERPRVLLWNAGGFTAGAHTLFDELVRVAGGRNAAAEAGIDGHARLPIEAALQMDPEVIFVSDYRHDGGARSVFGRPSLVDDPAWQGVRAVREGRALTLSGRHLRYSQHAVEGAARMARALHPDRFPRRAEREPDR